MLYGGELAYSSLYVAVVLCRVVLCCVGGGGVTKKGCKHRGSAQPVGKSMLPGAPFFGEGAERGGWWGVLRHVA